MDFRIHHLISDDRDSYRIVLHVWKTLIKISKNLQMYDRDQADVKEINSVSARATGGRKGEAERSGA